MFTAPPGGVQTHVRNACDACHKRKIRCIPSRNGGPCHHCHSRGLSCYFLPRYRSGRPRVNPPLNSPLGTTDHNAPISAASYATLSGYTPESDVSERRSYKDLLSPSDRQLEYRLQNPAQTQRSPSISHDALLDFQQPSFPGFSASPHPYKPYTDIPDHENIFETVLTPLSPQLTATPWSTPSQNPQDNGPNSELHSKAIQEYAFSNLLQSCSKLQRHLLATENLAAAVSVDGSILPPSQRTEMSDSQLQEMLEDMEANFKLILEICERGAASTASASEQPGGLPRKPTCSLLDPASLSLIMAVIFKALQVCNVLLSAGGIKARSIGDVLRYKRLDVSITLARVVISKVEALVPNKLPQWQELSHTVVHVERQFAERREKMEIGLL
jgi:hypothetical protein